MAITKNYRLTASAYTALTTTETWARVALRLPARAVRFVISSGGLPSASTADYSLWQLADLPFEAQGMDGVLYARADGQSLDVDVTAGTP